MFANKKCLLTHIKRHTVRMIFVFGHIAIPKSEKKTSKIFVIKLFPSKAGENTT